MGRRGSSGAEKRRLLGFAPNQSIGISARRAGEERSILHPPGFSMPRASLWLAGLAAGSLEGWGEMAAQQLIISWLMMNPEREET